MDADQSAHAISDDQHRVYNRCMIVTAAGTTDTGAVDGVSVATSHLLPPTQMWRMILTSERW